MINSTKDFAILCAIVIVVQQAVEHGINDVKPQYQPSQTSQQSSQK